MDNFKNIDMGKVLTIAGAVVTLAASLITSEQQKRSNHEIAMEVAQILRDEMQKGGEL